MDTPDCRIAALLSVLSESVDAAQCPLAVFASSLRESFSTQHRRTTGGLGPKKGAGFPDMSDVLAERSLALTQEEEVIVHEEEIVRVTYDKLRAELARVEAQLQSLERRAREVSQQKSFCKLAMNLLVTGEVPDLYAPDADSVVGLPREDFGVTGDKAASTTVDGMEVVPEAAPLSAASSNRPHRGVAKPLKHVGDGVVRQMTEESSASIEKNNKNKTMNCNNTRNDLYAGGGGGGGGGGQNSLAVEEVGLSVRNKNTASPTGTALLAMLRLPDVKETTLLHAIEGYGEHIFRRPLAWSAEQQQEVLQVLLALLKHLPHPRPPIQLAELRIIGHVLRGASVDQHGMDSSVSYPSSSATPPLPEAVVTLILHALLHEGNAVSTLTRLLQSVNDDVKCEVLDCLSPLMMIVGSSNSNGSIGNSGQPSGESRRVFPDVRKQFMAAGGLQPLVSIVASCTSEALLERSLVLLWNLLARNDDDDKVRAEVRRLDGLRAVLDLLYTDSIPILENVAMTIGYITREDASKVDIREAGGLEKITATLRHPYESIQTKMAGAVWNCASNGENRTYLRHIGCIPALLELLASPYEFVQENAAGALWNLSVDPENKTQILHYGGISELAQLIAKSTNVSVVENASGTLWNCSAAVETRPAIRKAAAIPVLLSVLDRKEHNPPPRPPPPQQQQQQQCNHPQEHRDRKLASNDSTTALPTSDKILDNVAGTLRNCAINDQNKPAIREAGGVELLLRKLEQGILLHPASILMPTLDKMASTLWILTISPEIKHNVRLSSGIPLLAKILEAASVTAAKKNGANPVVQLTMGVKEKIVGILRNCSTVQENRPAMVAAGVVRALVHTIDDCYLISDSRASTRGSTSSHQQQQQQQQPSLQLKETVASALWYISRDDKVAPREEGGLELLCRLLQEPAQPSVVLEQAAGALSSLTVSNQENRTKLREFGGLHALLRLIVEKAQQAFPQKDQSSNDERTRATAGGGGGGGAKTTTASSASKTTTNSIPGVDNSSSSTLNRADNNVSHTYAVLNALLAIRNSTSLNEENLRCVVEWQHRHVVEGVPTLPSFTGSLLYIIQHGSEDCAREAALCVKNLCAHAKAMDALLQQDAVEVLGGLAEHGSTDSVRRAAAMTLHSFARAQRR